MTPRMGSGGPTSTWAHQELVQAAAMHGGGGGGPGQDAAGMQQGHNGQWQLQVRVRAASFIFFKVKSIRFL